MSYLHRRSYIPGNLHRNTYGPTQRYGSGYQRVYGNGNGVQASELTEAAANVVRSLSPAAQETPAVSGKVALA